MSRSVAQMYEKYVGKKAMLVVLDQLEKEGRENSGSMGVEIPIKIVDANIAYGRERLLVEPHSGVGTAWIEANDKVRIVDEWPHEEDAGKEEGELPESG